MLLLFCPKVAIVSCYVFLVFRGFGLDVCVRDKSLRGGTILFVRREKMSIVSENCLTLSSAGENCLYKQYGLRSCGQRGTNCGYAGLDAGSCTIDKGVCWQRM